MLFNDTNATDQALSSLQGLFNEINGGSTEFSPVQEYGLPFSILVAATVDMMVSRVGPKWDRSVIPRTKV